MVLLIQVDDGWLVYISIDLHYPFKPSSLFIKRHWPMSTLSSHDIGASKSFNFFILQWAILVVKSFRTCQSTSCEVFKPFKLPVDPARHHRIAYLSDSSYLSSTGWAIRTCAKLRNNQGYSVPFCILCSLRNPSFIPYFAGLFLSWHDFSTLITYIQAQLTTERVII